MTKEKDKKANKEQLMLDAARLGQAQQLEAILSQLQQLKSKKRTNPLASLRKTIGPNNVRDPVTGFTCLHHASLNGHAKCVQLLLDYGAKLSSVDYKGSSALHLASWAGNLEVVRLLLRFGGSFIGGSGAGGNQNQDLSSLESSPKQQNEPSPRQQQQQRQQHLLLLDIINSTNNDLQTPLLLASQFGHKEVVHELISFGANVFMRNAQLESALDLACLNGRYETVHLLLNLVPELVSTLHEPESIIRVPILETLSSSSSATGNGFTSSQQQQQENQQKSTWRNLLKSKQHSPTTKTGSSSPAKQSPQRRATLGSALASNAGHNLTQILAKQSSADGACGQQTEMAPFDLLQQTTKLLDHSPLHYAVRRGHANIVNLLLYSYSANILQTTTLGSVLHEVALNNGKHSDMIVVIFNYLQDKFCNPTATNSGLFPLRMSQHQLRQLGKDTINRLLAIQNLHHKTVFDLLEEINNRFAKEIKRLMQDYSEQFKLRLFGANSQQAAPGPDSGQSQQQFSDMKQMSSFLTMKRGKTRESEQIRDSANFGPMCSTIDRRLVGKSSNASDILQSYAMQNAGPQSDAMMTRSVSNLCSGGTWHTGQAGMKHQHGAPSDSADMRKARSRSRDFGTLLMEAHANSNLQQQQAHRAINQHLVRSQTDCSHMMNRFVGATKAQQHNLLHHPQLGHPNAEQANRGAINRHYHVYDYEFYPPRLISQTGANSESMPPDGFHPNMPSCRSLNQASMADQYIAQQQQLVLADQRVNSRLSLNIDPQLEQQAIHQHQQMMDRFMGRHSHCRGSGQHQQQAIQDPRRLELMEWQRRLMQKHAREQQVAPQQQMHPSQSLESNLSEPRSFENSRSALMGDFEQILQSELLDHQPSQDANNNNSNNSILTGVSVDMDGERLTLSGTRLMSFADVNNSPRKSNGTTSHGSTPSSSSLSSQQMVGSNSELSAQVPSKPPRLSLLSKQKSHPNPQPAERQKLLSTSIQKTSGDIQHALIYDLPDPNSSLRRNHQKAVLTTTTTGSITKQPIKHIQTHSDPPRMRPPPPPSLESPLHVATDPSLMSVSFGQNSAGSSMSSNNENVGLLKMVSAQSSAGSASLRTASRHETRSRPTDLDSGVCTSNSPASLSHDSEGSTEQKSSSHFGSLLVAGDQTMLPPSPRTAQLHLEQAFQPLAKTRTSESKDQTSSSYVVTATKLPSPPPSPVQAPDVVENQYENCIALQNDLAKRNESSEEVCIADDDYARSSTESACSSSSDGSIASKSPSPTRESSEQMAKHPAFDKEGELPNYEHVSFEFINLQRVREIHETNSQPQDLKRTAVKRNCNMIDTGTLTDEELSIFEDGGSGLIGFTLRKRRNHSDETTQTHQEEAVTIEATKPKAEVEMSPAIPRLPTRRNSDFAPSTRIRSHQVDRAGVQKSKFMLTPINKDNAAKLISWFSTNFAGLIEYLDILLQNGFDSLQFLNNDLLMNESILASIGIADMSHQSLILDRIQQEVPHLDMAALLRTSFGSSSASITAGNLLRVLQVNHLIDCGVFKSLTPSDDYKALVYLKAGLPVGYETRIALALDTLREMSNLRKDNLAKKLSTDSNSEVEMDTSQASTSSSSETSVQSIVSNIKQQQAVKPTEPPEAVVMEEPPKENITPTGKPITRSQSSASEVNRPNPPVLKKISSIKGPNPNSLVGEAARKLEAAVAAAQDCKIKPLRPVAATRRVNSQLMEANKIQGEFARVETRKSFRWPPVHNQSDETTESTKSQLEIVKNNLNKCFENNNTRADQPATKIRPNKPLPPAKPAKLVAAAKFGVEIGPNK